MERWRRTRSTGATSLSDVLIDLSRDPYRRHFAQSKAFWDYLRSTMSIWEGADLARDRLAARGAPLKICAFAVCLLTARTDVYPALDRCLDGALTGLALYDDLGDWRADLEAGRWNAFVADLADRPQLPEFRERNRASVLVALMTRDAAVTYAGRITAAMTEAAILPTIWGSTLLPPT